MNDYIGLCRLGAWLDSFPSSYDLVPLLPILSNRRFSEVHRPRGSFDIDSSFCVLSHKVRAALFFFEFRLPELRPEYPSAVAGGASRTPLVLRRRTCPCHWTVYAVHRS